MTRSKRTVRTKAGRFAVGDRVRFDFVGRRIVGVVVEDRGPLGVGGRHLYAVRAKLGYSSDRIIELPADDLRAA